MTTPDQGEILRLLAREWDASGPPGILDISDVVAAIPSAPGDILAALRELYVDGLVDMNQLKTSVFLTPEGYDAAQNE